MPLAKATRAAQKGRPRQAFFGLSVPRPWSRSDRSDGSGGSLALRFDHIY